MTSTISRTKSADGADQMTFTISYNPSIIHFISFLEYYPIHTHTHTHSSTITKCLQIYLQNP